MLAELPTSNALLALASSEAFACPAELAAGEHGGVDGAVFRCGDRASDDKGAPSMCIHAAQVRGLVCATACTKPPPPPPSSSAPPLLLPSSFDVLVSLASLERSASGVLRVWWRGV